MGRKSVTWCEATPPRRQPSLKGEAQSARMRVAPRDLEMLVQATAGQEEPQGASPDPPHHSTLHMGLGPSLMPHKSPSFPLP